MQEESFFANPRSWVAIAFVIFFVLFGAKLWKALVGMLDKRTATVQAELDEASRLRREAETLLADATKRRQEALADTSHPRALRRLGGRGIVRRTEGPDHDAARLGP